MKRDVCTGVHSSVMNLNSSRVEDTQVSINEQMDRWMDKQNVVNKK